MKHSSSLLILGLTVVILAGLLPFPAFAENTYACSGNKNLDTIFCSITSQFRFFPKLLAVISYVIAAIMAITGLLQLKEYGEDPSKTPLKSILIKFALSAMLVSLPLAMQVFVSTVTGTDSISDGDSVNKPSLGSGVSGVKK